jgi:hypothetical protein
MSSSPSPVSPSTVVILIITAEPNDKVPLNLQQEINEIEKLFGESSLIDKLGRPILVYDKHSRNIISAYNEFKPNILHICGHGNKGGQPLFLDDESKSFAIDHHTLPDFYKIKNV